MSHIIQKYRGSHIRVPPISTVSQPEIVLIRTDDFLPSKLTVRLIVCLFRVSTSSRTFGLTSDMMLVPA